ncbi:MAG TPA: response regulator [Rhizomicrobium sp.]|nr:response regulator [Rhizomicrobium sp.]
MNDLKAKEILIVDTSGHSRRLLKQIFTLLGFSQVTCASSTGDALELLRSKCFHIVFCDESVKPHSPADFAKFLRSDLSTGNVIIPMVLISSAARFEEVRDWRDAGGNDVIVKPISTEVMKVRIASLILNPKPFVTTKTFIGPDRRRAAKDRRADGDRNLDANDRRRGIHQATIHALSRNHHNDGGQDGP